MFTGYTRTTISERFEENSDSSLPNLISKDSAIQHLVFFNHVLEYVKKFFVAELSPRRRGLSRL